MATKSAISFGLVHIPVSLHTATQDNDVHFNQLHKDDNSRIRYKKTCCHCGKEVKAEDIIKGFEYDKDQYVIVTDDDFESIKTEKDRTMQIIHFTTLDSISPVFYEKTYHAVPEAGELKKAAVIQWVYGRLPKFVMLIIPVKTVERLFESILSYAKGKWTVNPYLLEYISP